MIRLKLTSSASCAVLVLFIFMPTFSIDAVALVELRAKSENDVGFDWWELLFNFPPLEFAFSLLMAETLFGDGDGFRTIAPTIDCLSLKYNKSLFCKSVGC